MAELGGLAFVVLLLVALAGPLAVLIIGERVLKSLFVALFVSGAISMPLSAFGEPADFRGTAAIMSVLTFIFGLVAMSIAGAIRAPVRRRR